MGVESGAETSTASRPVDTSQSMGIQCSEEFILLTVNYAHS